MTGFVCDLTGVGFIKMDTVENLKILVLRNKILSYGVSAIALINDTEWVIKTVTKLH